MSEHGQVVHVTSWWQEVLGWFGIPTKMWCDEWAVASTRLTGVPVKCRKCLRAAAGETHA